MLSLNRKNVPSSGYVTIRIKEETPIFTKRKMTLKFPNDITHLAVSNNFLVCLMSHNVLLRLFLLRPDREDEVFLDKYLNGLSVSKLFLDLTGNHLLIALVPKSTNVSPELLYLNRRGSKPKRLDKLKDHEVTAVCFNYENVSDSNTGQILIGTSKGIIFETEFGIDGEKMFQGSLKQVFELERGKICPITGIQFFRAPKSNKFIILVTTIDRLYEFHEVFKSGEKPVLQNIFNANLQIPEEIVYETVPNSLEYSKLRFYIDATSKFPKNFAWLTKSKVLFGEIDPKAETPNIVLNKRSILLPLDSKIMESDNTQPKLKTPFAFVLTEFHIFFLYDDHVTVISNLNEEIIYEEYFSEPCGNLLNVIKDDMGNSIYIYSAKSIFRFKVTREERNVWLMYLEKKEYELAEKYSKENLAHLDIVLCKKAENNYNEQNYIQSAIIYSKTRTSFEKVCLKFLELYDKEPLLTYLRNRLAELSDEDKTQITMLVIWMIELHLTEISRHSDNPTKFRRLQRDFDAFMTLPIVTKCVRTNHSVICDLIASHGDTHNLTMLTTINKDFESVINQYINQNNYSDALSILRSQNNAELFYKFCAILLAEEPRETISAIMAQENLLQPSKLLSALVCIEDNEHILEAIKYLEYAVDSLCVADRAVHNFLIKLYAQHRQDKLEIYLEAQGRDITLVNYDVYYALRICQQNNATKACVLLQCLLEMWSEAVELALSVSSQLAQEIATQPTDTGLKRKLWLKIAEHEIKGKNDVKKALELLKECDLLKIEDLLPYFSDFQKIDDFKEVICDALKEYNNIIQEQQKDMQESAKSAEYIRNQLQSFRNRTIIIGSHEPCYICEMNLLIKPFFIFLCGHKFHSDCLEKQIVLILSPEKNRQLAFLKQQLENMLTQNTTESNAQQIRSREQIKIQIENILAADCLYCGVMIYSIDQPFIEDWE